MCGAGARAAARQHESARRGWALVYLGQGIHVGANVKGGLGKGFSAAKIVYHYGFWTSSHYC
jgi:hypothetical protein